MAPTLAEKTQQTQTTLLEAAWRVLLSEGYAGLSTRAVARAAGAPMSQIQYHFGSKQGLVLALFEHMNAQLLARQEALFADPRRPLSEQWERACDYLDDDLASGYVRVLHELIGASLANPQIQATVREGMQGWHALLGQVARRFEASRGPLPGLDADALVALVSAAFIGAEAQILLGLEGAALPTRRALRQVGALIRAAEPTPHP